MMINTTIKKNIFLYIILSITFVITVQQFPFFKGNSLHLIHAIKNMEFNKLQFDWIANQTNPRLSLPTKIGAWSSDSRRRTC